MGIGDLWEKYGNDDNPEKNDAGMHSGDQREREGVQNNTNNERLHGCSGYDHEDSQLVRSHSERKKDAGTQRRDVTYSRESQQNEQSQTERTERASLNREQSRIPYRNNNHIKPAYKTMPGVFSGNGDAHVEPTVSTKPRNFDVSSILNRIREWPWVDIVLIGITVAMILGTIFNYKKVTDSVFGLILRMVKGGISILFIGGFCLFCVMYFRGGSQGRRR